jgi:putative transcriptional regulator
MTVLGEFLSNKSIKKADVSRKTGISSSRLTELSRNESTKLRVDELYLISLAIDVSPIEILNKVCNHLKLKTTK